MVTHIQLLEACQNCYSGATIIAGPAGRDGATVTPLPDGGAILAFRGTLAEWLTRPWATFLDWKSDFNAHLCKASGINGHVHVGFLDTLDNLLPLIRPQLPESGPLYITGHSKGGAVAALAAARLKNLDPTQNISLVTFAAPRAGDIVFAETYPIGHAVRYEKVGDVVPLLPDLLLYHPVGQLRTDLPVSFRGQLVSVAKLEAEGRWQEIVANHHLSTYAEFVSREIDQAA